jgi:hypothetical protein
MQGSNVGKLKKWKPDGYTTKKLEEILVFKELCWLLDSSAKICEVKPTLLVT